MNKKLVWFTEIFIWIVIFLSLIFGCTYSFATASMKNHSYYMFFKDVDGLSKGSPVRMMGYHIGHVQDVKVFQDNIFVSFIVTEKNIYIPSGAFARVEFYGLGGSKSLEIFPPKEKLTENDVIISKDPYRVADYYAQGKKINTLLENMMTNTGIMLDEFIGSGVTVPMVKDAARHVNNVIQSFIEDENGIMNKMAKPIKNSDVEQKQDIEEENSSEGVSIYDYNSN